MKEYWNRNWLIAGIILIIISLLSVIPLTEKFENSPNEISTAIILDLVITIPLLYLIFIWKKQISKFSILYIFLLGILLANFIIPADQQYLISKVQYILVPIIEVGILSLFIYKMKTLNTHFKSIHELDFFNKATKSD